MATLHAGRRRLRYWFETDRPIRKRNLVVLDGPPARKEGFGPWMVASVRLADRVKLFLDPKYRMKRVEFRERYSDPVLPYGDGFVMGDLVHEVKKRFKTEILGGHAELLMKFLHIYESHRKNAAFVGYLVPDAMVFAPQIAETLKTEYAGTGASETARFIRDAVSEMVLGHQLVNYYCTLVDGASNGAFSSLEFKCGVCDQKASIAAGLASVLFATRIVGYGDVTEQDWEKACQLDGIAVTPDLSKFFLNRHYWAEILGKDRWIPINLMPNEGNHAKMFELQRRHFGKVCSEYVLNQ